VNWKEFLRPTDFKVLIFVLLLSSGVTIFYYVTNLAKSPIRNVTSDKSVSLILSVFFLLILDWPIALFSMTHSSSSLTLIPVSIVMGIYWYLVSSSAVRFYANHAPVKKKASAKKQTKRPNWLTIICTIGWAEAIASIMSLRIISIVLRVTIYWLWKMNKRGGYGPLS